MSEENWKMHPVFTDYLISDQGRTMRRTPNNGTWPGRIVKVFVSGDNPACWVHLRTPDGEARVGLVRKLVLEAHVGPCPDGWHATNIDGDQSNCALDNVEWTDIHGGGRPKRLSDRD